MQQGYTELSVIWNDQVVFPAFTSREYVPGANGVAVSTRAPTNLFAFADGESIAVSGGIVMRLAGAGEGRRLRLEFRAGGGAAEKAEARGSDGTRDLQASGAANAGFRLNVNLAEAGDGEMAPVTFINAAGKVANGGLIMLGMMIFSCAIAMRF